MLKQIQSAFLIALDSIRSNVFHTILSVLGIVIGVGALVAILSLIDGMEKYAFDQIENTTSLQAVMVNHKTYKRVDGISFAKDTFSLVDFDQFIELKEAVQPTKSDNIYTAFPMEITAGDSSLVSMIRAVASNRAPDKAPIAGQYFSWEAIADSSKVAVVTQKFAEKMGYKAQIEEAIGKTIIYDDIPFTIIGITKNRQGPVAEAMIPINFIKKEYLRKHPPRMVFEAKSVEDIDSLKSRVEHWLSQAIGPGQDDLEVITNEFRLQQVQEGFMLFRLIMGLIVGISVIVGGIGVMNVLLISVNERTVEIGLRKALGATKKDITAQFLTESVTVSLFGSLLGLILGILGSLAVVPIVKLIVEVPFTANFTFNTLFVITIVAILIGLIFGTYPAVKASKLDPVEAIRRE